MTPDLMDQGSERVKAHLTKARAADTDSGGRVATYSRLKRQQEIDVLKSEGWTETTINPAHNETSIAYARYDEWYTKTAEWIHLNATGDYKLLRGHWIFENKEDAVMFTLKWA